MSLPPGIDRDGVVARDRRYLWPPYTSSDAHERREPLVVVRGEGAWLYDADGRRVLDGNASWWTTALGHNHPRLVAALTRQAGSLCHVAAGGITHAPMALLAEELCAAAPPGLERVHFSDDGSTAIEVATKVAFQYWQQNGRPERTRFLALTGAYHGDTLGAASLASLDEFHAVFAPILFEVIRPPDPGEVDGWDRVVASVEATLKSRKDEIAALVVEPLVQGAGGMRMYPPALLRRLREATEAADTFLIADEVFTGFGRTGRMWACDHAEVTPDLLCVGKAFTGGVLPMAATLATGRVYDGFRGGTERALLHGHTFFGNPLGAAVAREVLAVYRDEGVVAQAEEKGRRMAAAVEALAGLPGVRRVRHLGMIAALDLGEGGYDGPAGWRVFDAALRRGAFLRPLGDTVYLTPPLTIPDDDLDRLLEIFAAAV
ncbi:MAG TPA: adenosylmethionine--8-amino-7-oxononanoate transaminase, partial [Polyangiaceae bacterium LLY-WYZ-14_1]|nr:adenosylmethionine--8-amino-7-oxononanoate transaminase [Polyangiaceae bacterium LLY-WYZ-14_1]